MEKQQTVGKGNVTLEGLLSEKGYMKQNKQGKVDFSLVLSDLDSGRVVPDKRGRLYNIKEYTLGEFLKRIGSNADVVKMLTNSVYFHQYKKKLALRLQAHNVILKYSKQKQPNGLESVKILLIKPKELENGKEEKQEKKN